MAYRKTIALAASALMVAAGGGFGAAYATPPTDTSQLVGTWVATTSTGGLVELVIGTNSSGLVIHPYASCSPTPCDWGKKKAATFSSAVTSPTAIGFTGAPFNFGFVVDRVSGHLVANPSGGAALLEVTSTATFASGDSRYDYEITSDFARQIRR